MINTCNLSSIELALKAFGIHCKVDDIFSALRLKTNWVVSQGLTLAEVFTIVDKLCNSTNSMERLAEGISAECFHFDEGAVDFLSFVEYLVASIDDENDILITNFSTKIARSSNLGGGHFAVISGFDKQTKMVSIADVHPLKYGAHYAIHAKKLFYAMIDKDTSSKRARGLIRLSYVGSERIHHLDDCRHTVSFADIDFQEEERQWLSLFGNLPINVCLGSHLNMGGLAALAVGLSGLLSTEDYRHLGLPNCIDPDHIIWTLGLSITELLTNLVAPRSLMSYCRRYCEKMSLNFKVKCENANLDSVPSLASSLNSLVGPAHNSVALVLIDLNATFGYEIVEEGNENDEASVLHHGSQHWMVIVDVLDDEIAIIADPQSKMLGRLWKCSLEKLKVGLSKAKEGTPGQMVVISKCAEDCFGASLVIENLLS